MSPHRGRIRVKEAADSFHVVVRPAHRFKETLHYFQTWAYLEDGRPIPFRAGLQRRGGHVLVESVWVPKGGEGPATPVEAGDLACVLAESFEQGRPAGGTISPVEL